MQDSYESPFFLVHHLDSLVGRQGEDLDSLQFLLRQRCQLHHPLEPCRDYQNLWSFHFQEIDFSLPQRGMEIFASICLGQIHAPSLDRSVTVHNDVMGVPIPID